jgi:hypothetical protein
VRGLLVEALETGRLAEAQLAAIEAGRTRPVER